MFKKGLFVLFSLLFVAASVSAATADVTDANAYSSDGTATLSYTLVQTNAETALNCTLYDDIDGSWGVSAYASVDTSLTNGSNSFVVAPPWGTIARADTSLFNVLCATNASTNIKDATNGTVTFYAYKNLYSVSDLNEQTVDVLGTGVNATIGWVDLLVLLAIVGIVVSILVGVIYKGSKIMGF